MLYQCCLVELDQACVPAECGGWSGRRERLGVVACMSVSPKQGERMTKDYSGYFFTVEGYMFDVALQCYIHRPVYVPENHSLLPPFFAFLLFCFIASPHSCFLYYFISVSDSLSLPPFVSLFLFFSSFPPSPSLPPFLPPTSHLCMCHFQL